ncbi:MAG: hypothetical protein OXC53_06900 [Rhodobacteraceae bacterium]|nr:hypothetical protein [Paracoccaceae bacterium]
MSIKLRICDKQDENSGERRMLPLSPQATDGDATDLDCATPVLHGYELRWRIARFFHALKQGTRIEDRHLDPANDLRKGFAFDAITAFRVWDLTHLARTRAGEPARRFVCQDKITGLCVRAAKRGVLKARAPPAEARAMTIERFVVLTGGLAKFHPAKHQPLPGTEKLWQGMRTRAESMLAIRTWEKIRRQENNAESSL